MEVKLKLVLIIVCLLFDCFVYSKIKKGKLQLKYSFVWYILTFILILFTIFDDFLYPIKEFLGFETLSNMVFLFGFFFLAMLTFSISVRVSEHNAKITKLTQEVALLKKECGISEKSDK